MSIASFSRVSIDDPWFTFVVFLSLVSGSTAVGGINPPHFLNFSLILATLIAARYLGGLVGLKKSPFTARTVSSAIEKLKRREKGADEAERVAQGELVEICLIGIVTAGLLSVFLATSEDGVATALVLGAASLLIYLRAKIPSSVGAVLVSAFAAAMLPCLLGVLGSFCQLAMIVPGAVLFGFVPGGMLGAALIARHAKILEDKGWQRSQVATTKKGVAVTRPRGVAQLYTGFLLIGFFIVFVLSSMGTIPRSFMAVVITMFFAPKVATEFLERTASDEQLFGATVRLAVLAGVLTLLAGAGARL